MSDDNVVMFPGTPLPAPSVTDEAEPLIVTTFTAEHWPNLTHLLDSMTCATSVEEYRAYFKEFKEALRRVPM